MPQLICEMVLFKIFNLLTAEINNLFLTHFVFASSFNGNSVFGSPENDFQQVETLLLELGMNRYDLLENGCSIHILNYSPNKQFVLKINVKNH
jgi:hypothetical protein